MHVFVLCTGRCGSTTFTKACDHFINYTAAHESRYRHFADSRLEFPDNHIEVDLRLAWYLGLLEKRYGGSAFYVHLTRDPELVADSFLRKFNRGGHTMGRVWFNILGKPDPRVDPHILPRVMLDMIEVVNANIEAYLRDKEHMRIDIANAKREFPQFCRRIGAEGDLHAACTEFDQRYNAYVHGEPHDGDHKLYG